jgi:ribosomal protein S18 acetylase RimI-like enzyme
MPPLPDRFGIRTAATDDARDIATVHVASWRHAYRGLLDEGYLTGLSTDELSDRWERLIDGLPPTEHLLVVETGGSVVGYAHIGPSRGADAAPRTGELYSLYVGPDHWDVGAGRAVHDAGLEAMAGDGHLWARLWMLGTNDRARRFYRRQGWTTVTGRRTQEFGGRTVIDERLGRSLAPSLATRV